MNAVSPLAASPLGPSADVQDDSLAAFVRDEPTREALSAALGIDWPGATVMAGGLADAIEHLVRDPSAAFLVVDISGVGDPIAALDRLADVCAAGTSLILIGDINDVTLYRALRTAGVADYLVKPITADGLRTSLAGARRRDISLDVQKPAGTNGKILAVVGTRGGVGVTTTAITLAWLFANEQNRRTMLVDLDLHCGSAALALDAESSHGLCEALETPNRIDSLFVSSAASPVGDNLYLLSSEEPFDQTTVVRPGAIERLAAELKRDFARIVIDIPRADAEVLRQCLAETHNLIIVTDLSLVGLRETGRLIALAKTAAPAVKPVIVASRVSAGHKGVVPIVEFEKSIGQKFAIVIPEDDKSVPHALNAGKPLPIVAKNSKAVLALRLLANRIGEPPAGAKSGLFSRFLGGTTKAKK
jgi:pilus assembly protein CpaE